MIATVTLNPSLDEWLDLDRLRVGALNRSTNFSRYPAGKGINVSRVIRELGARTVAFATAGGEDGLILRELMNRLSVPHAFVTIPGATRNNYKICTSHPRAVTEINTQGPRVLPSTLQALFHRLSHWTPRPGVVALCGSLPPGVSVRIYAQWIRRLRRARIPVVLDTSGDALREGAAARPWLIKPDHQEAEELLGRRLKHPRQFIHAAQQLVRHGPELAILSLGKDGALLAGSTLRGVWWGRSPAVRVASSVGAGDSLVGGFLVGWMQDRNVLEAFRLGIACGTATAMTPGTELCHRADVLRLLRRITIRRVA